MGPPRPPLAEAIAAVIIAIHWVTYLSESEQAWTWRRPRHKSRASPRADRHQVRLRTGAARDRMVTRNDPLGPAGQHVMRGPVAKVHERGRHSVDGTDWCFSQPHPWSVCGPGGESGFVRHLTQRATSAPSSGEDVHR